MKTYYTGSTGSIRYDNARLIDVADWAIQADLSPVETTTLGDTATTFRYSRPSYSGTLTIYADQREDSDIEIVTADLLRTSFSDQSISHDLILRAGTNVVRCNAVFESVNYEIQPGSIVAAALSFRISGQFTEYNWTGEIGIEIETLRIGLSLEDLRLPFMRLEPETLSLSVALQPIELRYWAIEMQSLDLLLSLKENVLIAPFALVETLALQIALQQLGVLFNRIYETLQLDLVLDPKDQDFTRAYVLNADTLNLSVGLGSIGLNPPSFDTLLYTGNASTQTISGSSIEPGLVWIRRRLATANHFLFDRVRGPDKPWVANSTSQELSLTNSLTAFTSDGFTLGSLSDTNANNAEYVAWCWANPGAVVSNTTGTITANVAADASNGISIVNYAGNATSGATVGHGLGASPNLVIVKSQTAVTAPMVWTSTLSANFMLQLNSTTGQFPSSTNVRAVTSSTIELGNATNVNGLANYILYAFVEKSGLSDIGSYSGLGITDVSVNFGFQPQFVLIKSISTTGSWFLFDDARGVTKQLTAASAQEATVDKITFSSTGFTVKSGQDVNTGSVSYLYMAFR
jgi:hypothetical protein